MSQDYSQTRKRIIRRQTTSLKTKMNLPSSNDNENSQQSQVYVRKKPEGLICSICEGPAHGYNFDAITCESCKAFFRRNALRSDGKFKCRAGDGRCLINVTTRKRCKACRLAKCFEKGMRADWILTDEERVNKRRKIEENRHLRRTLYPDSVDFDDLTSEEMKTQEVEKDNSQSYSYVQPIPASLSVDQRARIEHITHAYDDSVRLTFLSSSIPTYPQTARLDEAWEMVNGPANIHAARLITYFKLLPEFCALTEHDKLVLIKFNTFALVFMRSALNYDQATDSYHERGTDNCVFEGKDLIQCFSLEQYRRSTRCICRLLDASQNDRLIIQLWLIVILFSKGSAMCTYTDEAEPILEDGFSIYRNQNIFLELLWRYCESQYGFEKTVEIYVKMVTTSLSIYIEAYNTRHNYVKNDLVADQLVPLMKSVMLIV